MRRHDFCLLALFAAALGACSSHGQSPTTEADVRAAAQGIVAAYNRQDAHATAAYDAPDYVGVYHGTPNTVGPAADEAAMKQQMSQAKLNWELGDSRVTISKDGDLAVLEAPYRFIVTSAGGAAVTETGTWTAIFKEQKDGSLKLWRSIATNGPAATEPSTGASG